MAALPFGLRHGLWRTWMRGHTPNVLYHRLGLVVPKARDCGDHEWYHSDDVVDRCYHCEVERPTVGWSQPHG